MGSDVEERGFSGTGRLTQGIETTFQLIQPSLRMPGRNGVSPTQGIETYSIVGSTEADPFENKISNESPIAIGIMGKKVGARVTIESPNGNYDIEVVSIK